jgi:capsular polysaccharide transport system permease protein
LAANDNLFQKATDRFHLRALSGRRTIEAIKKNVLRVGLIRDSRVLEIAVTLPDATRAQELAQFLAEQTVGLSQSVNTASGRDLVDAAEHQERDAEAQFDRSEKALSQFMTNEPTDDLQNEIREAGQLRGALEDQIAELRLDLAGGNGAAQEQPRARLAEAQRQLEALNRDVAAKERLLAGRIARRGHLEGERRADQADLATMQAHLRDARSQVGFRGERLAIIDRGVIPERPSSPNAPLNLSIALVLGCLLALGYLMLELVFQQQSNGRRGVVHALAEVGDQ